MANIVFSQLGVMGRLGNQCFELASCVGLAKKYGFGYAFPYWKYSQNFLNTIPVMEKGNYAKINEKGYHYTPEYWDSTLPNYTKTGVDITGWLQSEKYFKEAEKEVRELFTFKPEVVHRVRRRFEHIFEKPVIAISVRRGDFVKNSNYELLPAEYYVGALVKYFPDYKDYNILLFSDDLKYCRHHFQCLPNAYYSDSCVDIEQLILMTQCSHYIISNSTFSWWGAWLGQKEHSIVVRPNYNLAGELKRTHNEKDYWPESWTNIYDYKKDKIDLRDVTFTIPVNYDHEDRMQNFKVSTSILSSSYDTNILVGEQGGNHFARCGFKYINFPYQKFHRTKMLNQLADQSKTDIIANWDADVSVPPMQIWETVKAIREGADMVYPYDGRFSRMERRKWYTDLRDLKDTGITANEMLVGARPQDGGSVGGAVFFKRDSFFEGGMENENFISYAPEDQERYHRFSRLGYKVLRIVGQLFHMDHHVGANSNCEHPLYKANEAEFRRILNIKDLREEIKTWPWWSVYTSKYYEEIMEGSTKSRDEVFKLPEVIGGVKSIIDVGCGIGFWGKNLSINYTGVDFRIPKKHLQIPETSYYEYNLEGNEDFPVKGRFDLCLCLEVLEHIQEKFAERSIKLLTDLSDKVLFSAAIPGQQGNGHINLQWQTYWAEIFRKFDYYPVNLPIRNNKNIEIWYRNNMILYNKNPTDQVVEDYIHPQMYTNLLGSATHWKDLQPYTS